MTAQMQGFITSGTAASGPGAGSTGTALRRAPAAFTRESNVDDALRDIMRQPSIKDLKMIIEAAVAQNVMQAIQAHAFGEPSAFDAIYISALTPDRVEPRAIATLTALAGVRDLSDQIRFNDGWDE